MPHRSLTKILAVAALASVSSVAAAADGELWIKDDMDAALKAAQKDGKDILIDFTGSDWCGWCIKLKDEVFTQSQFKEEAPGDFVLLELDFPRSKPQTEEVKAKNQALAAKYAIRGYPTIILANAKGEAWGRTGYRPGGAGPYLTHLDELRGGRDQVMTLLADAKKQEGASKAKLLDEAMTFETKVEGLMIPNRLDIMKSIVAADPENEAGLRDKYAGKIKEAQFAADIAAAEADMADEKFDSAIAKFEALLASDITADQKGEVAMNFAAALAMAKQHDKMFAFIDTMAADEDMPVEMRMQLMFAKIDVFVDKGDMEAIKATLDQAIALDPANPMAQNIAGQRDMIMQSIQAEIDRRRAAREAEGDGANDG